MSDCEKTHGPHAHDPEETICESEAELVARHDRAEKAAEAQSSARTTSKGVATYREFASALIEIGLMESAELERFAVDSAEGVLGLSSALVKAGKLTPYQAAAVYQNKSRGLLIGNYLILDKVGQGGMGVVFKARHRKLGRVGALKILPPSFTRDRGAVSRFRREFEAAARLKHVNLVAAFEADEDRGVHYLVMDYVVGINLDRVVGEHGPLPVPEAVDYLIQSARGLEAAHEKGIIHRDIKPGNLMLDHGGTVRVLDLGLARIIDASNPFSKTITGRLTQSGTYMGSIDYMAPEQAEDAHSADHRADIYSLGCTFFFLLTGREPFSGTSILKRMVAHQEHAAPSLRAIRPDVSPALEAAYQKMMAKKPEERPASMSEVIALLQASKHATADDAAELAPSRQPRPAPDACRETPLKRASSPRTTIDSAIFARRVEVEGTLVDRELNLRDLVMDVRSDAGGTGEPCAVSDDTESARDDHELNLRELAMELRAEAATPAAPKPTAGAAQPLKPAALPRLEATLPAAPKPTAATGPLKRGVPPQLEETPPAALKRTAAAAQPLKPAALPRIEATLPAAAKPTAATGPLRRSGPTRQDDSPAAAPKPPAAEIQPLEAAAMARPGDLAPSKGLAILAFVTGLLLVVAIALFVTRGPTADTKNENSTQVLDQVESASSSDVAPPPP